MALYIVLVVCCRCLLVTEQRSRKNEVVFVVLVFIMFCCFYCILLFLLFCCEIDKSFTLITKRPVSLSNEPKMY